MFEESMNRLEAKIKEMPPEEQPKLLKLLEETRERHINIKDSAAKARTALDDLSLALKYMVFDAEATARESRE